MRITKKTFAAIHSQVPGLLPVIILNAVLGAVKPFAALFFMSFVIDELYRHESFKNAAASAVLYLLFLFITELLMAVMSKWKEIWLVRLSYRQDARLSAKAVSMDYESLEQTDTQVLLESIKQCKFQLGDIFEREVTFAEQFLCALLTAALGAGFTIELLFVKSPDILSPVFIFAVLLLFLVIAVLAAKNGITHTQNVFKRFSEVAPINRIYGFYRKNVFQNYRYGKEIRIFKEQELIESEFGRTHVTIREFMENVGNQEGRFRIRNTILNTILTGLAYLYVGMSAYYEMIGVGSVVKYAGAVNQLLNGITDSVRLLSELQGNGKYLKQYFDFLSIEDKKALGTRQADGGRIEIEFSHVYYKYANTDQWAVKDVSFKIVKGEHIAIVGENGSGITTCIRLLCRLYEPAHGRITLNGVDIRDYGYEQYISLISAVFQDFKLFSFTLNQNIASAVRADEKRVRSAAEAVGLKQSGESYLYQDFESGGIEISGGEAQKTAIARAIYKDAPLLIMDEPTAALDPIAEAQVYNELNCAYADKTVLYISHRLSSCIFCSKILVFCQGELIEQGENEQLLRENGKYAQLWSAQASQYIDEKQAQV